MGVNPNENIEVISSKSSRGLRLKLKAIRTPYSILNIYFDGKEHMAWINPDRPFGKKMLAWLDGLDKKQEVGVE